MCVIKKHPVLAKDSPSVEALSKYEKDSFSGIEMKWLPRWKLQDEMAPSVEAAKTERVTAIAIYATGIPSGVADRLSCPLSQRDIRSDICAIMYTHKPGTQKNE